MNEQPSFWHDYTQTQISDERTGGPVGRDHPDTSKRAATKVRSGSQRYKVLHALYDWGGQTAFELSKRVSHDDGRTIAPNQIATRLGELRDLGLVVRSRQFDDGPWLERATTPGNRGIVHEITLVGIHVLLAERSTREQ
jgi:DNA-binding HxlR family transcriptional regulator